MANDKEIILRVEHVIAGGAGTPVPGTPPGGTTLPSQKKAVSGGFVGGISAQLFVSGFTQVLGATGNQQVAGVIRQGAEWGFLVARAASLDVTAMATIAFKGVATVLREIEKIKEERRQQAQKYNDLTMLQLRSGQLFITANTVTSYDKWGRLSLSDRK
jgi:hypothetical protein